MNKYVTTILFSAVRITISTLQAQEIPYPASPVIMGVEWDYETIQEYGHGSDQWPMTWAEDGYLYAAWGDGYGFANHMKPKQSLGITRIKGSPPKMTGDNLWGIPVEEGKTNAKPQALIAIGERLFMFFNTKEQDWKESMPAWSDDGGKTWEIGKQPVFDVRIDSVQVKGICQFGKGYAGAVDNYIYVYLAPNEGTDIYLGRVNKEHLFDRSKYKYFVYCNKNGNAKWTKTFSEKKPVFHDNGKMIWHISVSYNPGIKRYLLSKPHFTEVDLRWEDVASLGIFDSPKPWGPWTTVLYQDNFVDDKTKFNYILPTKVMSPDGLIMWLAWSGWPEYDSISFIKCTLKVKKD